MQVYPFSNRPVWSVLLRPFLLCFFVSMICPVLGQKMSLFDGKSFSGWEGDTKKVWRIENGVIVGGSLNGNPQNEFLATKKSFDHFRLTLEYKLVGTEGFVNGGVQFRSKRIAEPANEMIGYQADIGAGWSGSLYDESRRRTMLATADKERIRSIEKPGDWNTYEIIAEGGVVKLFLNGVHTVTYVESDLDIPLDGKIALQIHGNCKAEISFRNIEIETLPAPSIPPDGVVYSRFGDGQPMVSKAPFTDATFLPEPGEVVVLIGQENFVREQKAGSLESRLVAGFPQAGLRFRSMAWEADTVYEQWRDLHFGGWKEQLQTAEAGVLIIQFGQMEVFDGVERLPEFKAAYHRLLDEFSVQTRRCVLVSPMPFEKPLASHAPDLIQRNRDVAAYADAVWEIARERQAVFVDLVGPLSRLPKNGDRLTEDGIHLTPEGLEIVGSIVAQQLGAESEGSNLDALKPIIAAKNRLWFDAWRPANWSFAYGDRVSQLFGSAAGGLPSLHGSFQQRRPMIDRFDDVITRLVKGEAVEVPALYSMAEARVSPVALTPEEQLETFEPDDGYQVNLFASEEQDVVNPIQIAWDERGRLYVACSPAYPQSLASMPASDYVVVLEDVDHDGKADRHWRYAEGLNMIQGLEPGPDGLYVCDFDQLVFLKDIDGDDRADERHILFSGFGVGDTHQLINSISHGMDGSLWFTQGLHAMSQVESPWGIKRLDRAAVWRLRPRTLRLDGFFGGGMAGANCWGVVYDDFGQVFHKTGDRPHGYWTVPGMVRGASPMGSGSREVANQSYANSPEQYHSVGAIFETSPKTTSIDIVGTQAMPDEIQGTALIGGYFGSVVELHRLEDDGAGFKTTQLPRVLRSTNNAFRPVDVSMGPDGAMYLADWYNEVIGHYQASYADPKRDKHHGRIWRISSTRHAPVRQPDLAGMSISELLDELKSPERWTRYQSKRLLYDKPSEAVIDAADRWLEANVSELKHNGQLLVELTGVYQAHETSRASVVDGLLASTDFRVRAYGARVAGEWAHQLKQSPKWLRKAVHDDHPRVRLEGVVACSILEPELGVSIATEALQYASDKFLDYALRQSVRALQPGWMEAWREGSLKLAHQNQKDYLKDLIGNPPKPPGEGQVLFEMACMPCHQPDGKGLAGVYPPLAKSDRVQGSSDALIRIVLHGLEGPIRVNGVPFRSSAPVQMPAFAGLSDPQLAALLSYLRGSFGNDGGTISADEVSRVRVETRGRQTPWTFEELR
jgi:putative membrane-bound dehydrogenase-like protein